MKRFVIVCVFILSFSQKTYAFKASRYGLEFLNMSSFYKNEIVLFQKYFADDYLVNARSHWISSAAVERRKKLLLRDVAQLRTFMETNPLYLIDWPREKDMIFRVIKELEKEKRN